MSNPTPGIWRRHSSGCPARRDEKRACRCGGIYTAAVWDKNAGRKIRKNFPSAAAARAWRADAMGGVRRGTIRASEPTTVNEAADELLAGMESGAVRTRSGDPYKPATIRSYRETLDLYVRDDLGAMRLTDVQRRHVQRLADGLVGEGRSPSTVRNALMPLRVIFRRALRDGIAAVNPCDKIDLPANRSKRVVIVSPDYAAKLIAALDGERDRALWATAFYAGLRCGELMALRWRDLDLATGVVHVERSYDPKERAYGDPKSRAGWRSIPTAAVLRGHLRALAIASRRSDPDALVFGDEDGAPFRYDPANGRAKAAWKEDELEPVGLHAARHTAASVMIAAGINVKALSTFMGHASITITLDRYGHLLPGSIAEAASLLDAFLGEPGSETGSRELKPLEISTSERS